MRDYGKVHTKFWSSKTIRALSEDGRTLAMYLLTCPHSTIAGVFHLPDGYVCEDLNEEKFGWNRERVAKGFTELFRNGWANRCVTTKWVWIVDHFEWNALENPNQRTAAKKIALSVPDGCSWNADFIRKCGPIMAMTDDEISNRIETLPEPLPNQDQDQDQDQEQDQEQEGRVQKPSPSAPPPTPEAKAKKAPKGSTDTRSQRIPEDFGLTSERQAYAEKHLPNVDAGGLMETFRAKADADGWKKIDWDRHWQTLVRQWAPNSGHWSSGQYPRASIAAAQPSAANAMTYADGRPVRW